MKFSRSQIKAVIYLQPIGLSSELRIGPSKTIKIQGNCLYQSSIFLPVPETTSWSTCLPSVLETYQIFSAFRLSNPCHPLLATDNTLFKRTRTPARRSRTEVSFGVTCDLARSGERLGIQILEEQNRVGYFG